MSDEPLNLDGQLLKNEELDVEGHVKKSVTDEPTEGRDDDDDVEAHVRKSLPRKI